MVIFIRTLLNNILPIFFFDYHFNYDYEIRMSYVKRMGCVAINLIGRRIVTIHLDHIDP